MSDTPRTDELARSVGGNPDNGVVVPIDFARELERDYNALRAILNRICPDEHTFNTGVSATEVRAALK